MVVIDLEGKSSLADYMVIASGHTQRHLGAMTEHLEDKLKAAHNGRISTEGQTAGDWILVDAGDVIVHLFRPEVRKTYALEKMWAIDVPGAEAAIRRRRRASA